MYVLRCTTIGLKQERGHKTSRRANMNPIQAPFHGKKRSVLRHYVAENEILCWCYLTPFMFICSVVCWYVYVYTYREGYTNINQVIGIILLGISPTVEIYRLVNNRRTVNTSTVRIFLISWVQKTRVKYCYVDLWSWYEIWFAVKCIGMKVIVDLSTTTQQF